MRVPSYYSSSRNQWVPVNTMANHHLVNALAKSNCTEDEADALKAEILRRLEDGVRPLKSPAHPLSEMQGFELARLEPGEVILTEQAVMVAVVITKQGVRAIVTNA